MQLWVSANEISEQFMTAGKFLSIYEKVGSMIDVNPAAEVRFEYGDENFFPSNYHVDSVIEKTDALLVELRPPQTTCKARESPRCRSELLLLNYDSRSAGATFAKASARARNRGHYS